MTECITKFRNWKNVSTLELGERFDQLNKDGIDDNTDLEYFVTKVNEVLEDIIPEKRATQQVIKHSQVSTALHNRITLTIYQTWT